MCDLFLILSAAVIITLPILIFGIPSGNDMPQHYQFALTFSENLQNGNIYPNWSGANQDFGDAGIRFYPPLSYYVLIFFDLISGDWFVASKLTFVFWFFLGGLGVYFWAREWFSENASLLGALLYIFTPYHANQIYNAFTYAEFAAASILPFCFLFVTRICRGSRVADVIGLGVSFGLLILTHLPMTVIGSLALLIYSLATLRKQDIIKSLTRLACSPALGLLASAFYWVRIVTELNFVNHAKEEFISGAYDFHSNFLAAFFYVSSDYYLDRSLWFGDLILLVTLGFFIPSIVIFYYCSRAGEKPGLIGVVILLAFAVFIATPLSVPIWENFSYLQKVQFPWRWLAIISLCGTILAVSGFEHLASAFRSRMRPLVLLAVGFMIAGVVFTATQIIRPAILLGRSEFQNRIENLAGAESCKCWWPVWGQRGAFAQKTMVVAENRGVEITMWDREDRSFRIDAGKAGYARIATFWYPHWKAEVNGTPVQLHRADDGTILIPIRSEAVKVKLFFQEPLFLEIAKYVSLITWLTILLSLWFVYWRGRRAVLYSPHQLDLNTISPVNVK